jgi:hypothetical protein
MREACNVSAAFIVYLKRLAKSSAANFVVYRRQ